ncbi:MAG: hypothetical protein ACFCUI_06710 [Bernardetiaceae bacterium]
MKIYHYALSLLVAFLLVACGDSAADKRRDALQKSPVDILLRDLDKHDNFAILLYDMEIKEGSFSDQYQHRYKVTYEVKEPMMQEDKDKFLATKKEELEAKGEGDKLADVVAPETKTVVKDSLTQWYDVSEAFFTQHANDMGMEIANKYDGTVTKQTSPPGYSRYVGNDQYGHWQTRSDGSSFWAFYGQYMFMSTLFAYAMPISRAGYGDYRRSYTSGRPYYGSGSNRYGTGSANAVGQNKALSSKSSSFRDKMSRVQRSTSSGTRASSSGRSTTTGRSSGSTSRSRSSGSRGGK